MSTRSTTQAITPIDPKPAFLEHNMDHPHHSDTSTLHDDYVEHSPSTGTTCKRRKRSGSGHRLPWEQRIRQLQDYKATHGDLLIPIRFKENPSLGKFVHNTREQYKLYQEQKFNTTTSSRKKAKKCSLTGERVAQLDELGFAWSTERTKQQTEDWNARLQQLKAYKAKHGDCLVPHGYQEDPSLAEWVHRQRTTYAHMVKEGEETRHSCHNTLVEERMKLLEEMGFHFTVHADKWMEHWKELKMFRDTFGHCQVPTHFPSNPKLGRWVHTQRHQRRLYLKGKTSCMTDERVRMLNSLGFSWEVRTRLHSEEELGPRDPTHGEHYVIGDLSNHEDSEDYPEERSMGGSGFDSGCEVATVPPLRAPDLDCTLQAHQDGTDGNQVHLSAPPRMEVV